jgi:hypothetical protein
MTNRSVETTEDFKLRIAAIIGDKREHIAGAPRPNPLLVHSKKRAVRTQKRHRRRLNRQVERRFDCGVR